MIYPENVVAGWYYLSHQTEPTQIEAEAEQLAHKLSYIPGDYQQYYQWYLDYYKNYERFPTWEQFKQTSQMENEVTISISEAKTLHAKNLALWESDSICDRMKALPLVERRTLLDRQAKVLQSEVTEPKPVLSDSSFDLKGTMIKTEKTAHSDITFPIKRLNEVLHVHYGNTISVLAPPGMCKCFDKETRILTDKGYLPIGQFTKGLSYGWTTCRSNLKVMTPEGFKPIKRFFRGRDPVWKTMFSDGTSLISTDEHWIETELGCITPVKNISVGDYVIKTCLTPDFVSSITPQVAYCAGLFLGDGSTNGHPDSIQFLSSYPQLEEYWRKIAYTGAYGRVGLSRREGRKTLYVCSSTKNTTNLDVWNLLSLVDSRHKRLPEALFSASLESRCAFLAGYLDTDGYNRISSLEFDSVSELLIHDLASLCNITGFSTTFRERQTSCQNGYSGVAYRLHCTPLSPEVVALINKYSLVKNYLRMPKVSSGKSSSGKILLGTRSREKYLGGSISYRGYKSVDTLPADRLLVSNKLGTQLGVPHSEYKTLVKVVSKELLPEQDVFDLEVDTEDHLYYAFGCLTHNTQFMENLAYLNSVEGDGNSLYIFLENLPQAYLADILARYSFASGTRIENASLKDGVSEEDLAAVKVITDLKKSYDENKKAIIYFKPFSDYPTDPLQFGDALAADVNRLNIKYIYLDYLQRCKVFAPLRTDASAYLNQIMSTVAQVALGGFGAKWPSVAAVGIQPNRDGITKAERTHGKFNVAACAECSSIERDSFVILALYASAEDKAASQLNYMIIKNRDGIVDVSPNVVPCMYQYAYIGDMVGETGNNVFTNEAIDELFDLDL